MGLFPTGIRHFGYSSGLAVKVFSDTPGPQRIRAWNPLGGTGIECGILSYGDIGPAGQERMTLKMADWGMRRVAR